MKAYGQFCGLARATELVGERWTLLILRDLLIAPARFSELRAGLPGIAATMLSARLRDLQRAGIVTHCDADDGPKYELTNTGRDLGPALKELSMWGAAGMANPRRDEVVTARSLASMLMTTRTDARVTRFVVQVDAAGVSAHAMVHEHGIEAHPGPTSRADLVISGTGLRHLLAHPDSATELINDNRLQIVGSSALLQEFTRAFRARLRTT